MTTLYLDLGMGAAGDMLTAALLELLPADERAAMIGRLNALGIPGVTYAAEEAVRCGIHGTHMAVLVNGEEESADAHPNEHEHEHHHGEEHPHEHEHHHHHSSMHEIGHVVADLPVSDRVKADILAVYDLIADAESRVHGVPVTEIHFHEVGAMDAVADVAAVCLLMEKIAPDQVIASPVNTGSGQVVCAHGIMPVPAPATALLLEGIPIYAGTIRSELCTPTGAALLRHFVTKFGDMPVMRTRAIGYGCGRKEFEAANCVRAILGEIDDAGDRIVELKANIDDMTAESMAFAEQKILDAGAVDIAVLPAQMKKGRPGFLLLVQCREDKRDQVLAAIFCHTSTIGVREEICRRYILDRKSEKTETSFGPVRKKISKGYGTEKSKYEYADLARIADERGLSLDEVREQVLREESGNKA